jgi:hypothetical protein
MGRYWWKIFKLAGKQAAELVGFGSAERAVVTVALQATIALLIYLLLGTTELHDNMGTRIATAVAPLSVLPFILLWKLFSVPAQLHKEQMTEEERDRHMKVMYLANMYVNEVPTPDAKAINNGLLNPPEDWVNNRLKQYGHEWRVTFLSGGKMEFYDANTP